VRLALLGISPGVRERQLRIQKFLLIKDASLLNVTYFKVHWGSATNLNFVSIVKTLSEALNPNQFHIWLSLFFGPNHQKVMLEDSWDSSIKLRQYYRIECFDEHGDWEHGWGTAEGIT